jgi:hypothetical protein
MMKKNETKDQLLNSFADFQITQTTVQATIGGSTDGCSSNPCGLSEVWTDLPNGGCRHMQDYIPCD